jgi:hypothetical protein
VPKSLQHPPTVEVESDLLMHALNILADLPYNRTVPGAPQICSGDVVTALRAAMQSPAGEDSQPQ